MNSPTAIMDLVTIHARHLSFRDRMMVLKLELNLLVGMAGKTIFGGAAKKNSAASDEEFDQFKNQLLQRTDAVSGGLKRMGLRVAQLNTEELIELFYGLFNPTESQKITEEKANQ